MFAIKNYIYINGIEVYGYHGVFAEENTLGQKFIFDIKCELNYKQAMITDDLTNTVSYADVANLVYNVSSSKIYKLLERLSFEIIKEIFNNYTSVQSIELKINKPNAPIQKIFSSCGIEIIIRREDYLKMVE